MSAYHSVSRCNRGQARSTHLKGVELDVCIPVGEAFDEGLDRLLRAVGCIAQDAVAYVHDGGPILRGEVLIRRLGCKSGNSIAVSNCNGKASTTSRSLQQHLWLGDDLPTASS